jgi:cytochrome c oxidase assembly factor CtaG
MQFPYRQTALALGTAKFSVIAQLLGLFQDKIDYLILFLCWHSTFSLGVGIGEKLEHRLIANHLLQLCYIMYTYNG